MPGKLVEGKLQRLLARGQQPGTIRQIAREVGVSRSYAQRKLTAHFLTLQLRLTARDEAGPEALPAGHPLSWDAISQRPFERAGAMRTGWDDWRASPGCGIMPAR